MAEQLTMDKIHAFSVTDVPLHEFAQNRMLGYGTYVIENRALPDFRDGLKPVQRRILYDMHHELKLRANGPRVKSARVVGDTMGKFHPHGDQSIYDTAVSMANSNTPQALIAGQGNFGEFNEKPAAMRYTEMRLTHYCESFMQPDYMAIVPLQPNYDGVDQEPIYLPALLPNLLFNGVSGIAVGVTVNIPPFAPKGVLELVNKCLRGSPITPQDCSANLRIKYPTPFNSVVNTSKADLLDFYKTGRGRLELGIGYEIEGNSMTINRFPPYFAMDTAKLNLLTKIAEVASADDISDEKHGKLMVIRLKASVGVMERGAIFEKCAKMLNNYINLSVCYIERINADKVLFHYCNLPELISRWVAWRIKLEARVNKYLRRKAKNNIKHLKLLVLACDNLDKLVAEIKRQADNLDQRVSTALGISLEDAKTILGVTVRSLSAMSRTDLIKRIKVLRREVKQFEFNIGHPAKKVLADMEGLQKLVA